MAKIDLSKMKGHFRISIEKRVIYLDSQGLEELECQVYNLMTEVRCRSDLALLGNSLKLMCQCGREHRLPPENFVYNRR